MTIIDNRKNPTTSFSNIEMGEIFFSSDTGCFYIRVQTICSDDDDRYNAVDLSDGYLVYFAEDEAVEKVKANITITNA